MRATLLYHPTLTAHEFEAEAAHVLRALTGLWPEEVGALPGCHWGLLPGGGLYWDLSPAIGHAAPDAATAAAQSQRYMAQANERWAAMLAARTPGHGLPNTLLPRGQRRWARCRAATGGCCRAGGLYWDLGPAIGHAAPDAATAAAQSQRYMAQANER